MRSILEAVKWVCDGLFITTSGCQNFRWRVEKQKVLEALQYDSETPCVVQWRMCNDREEKFRMVVKRMASTFGLEAVSCVSRKPKLSGAMDPGTSAR